MHHMGMVPANEIQQDAATCRVCSDCFMPSEWFQHVCPLCETYRGLFTFEEAEAAGVCVWTPMRGALENVSRLLNTAMYLRQSAAFAPEFDTALYQRMDSQVAHLNRARASLMAVEDEYVARHIGWRLDRDGTVTRLDRTAA